MQDFFEFCHEKCEIYEAACTCPKKAHQRLWLSSNVVTGEDKYIDEG